MDNNKELNSSTSGDARKESEQDPTPDIDQMTIRSDLRSAKAELFSKLVENQSQQMIVTIPNNADGVENLHSSSNNNNQNNSSNSNIDQFSSSNVVTKQPTNDQQQPSAKQPQNQRQLFPEDLKREPIDFSRSRSRWYTNEEVASILTNFSAHPEWQTNELQVRPKSGAVLLYSREKVRYRQDGYCWKKRKNGRTTREDHMKLKVQGIECIYGCYVHSAILPTFHRRCYWLLENPDIVLVHYLNQPPDDQNKMMITLNSSLLEADTRRSWTNEEIIEEIGSVFGGISQIKHTLNINFPPAAAITHQQLTQEKKPASEGSDLDGMTESSPQSQQSQATVNSEIMHDHIDMNIIDQQDKGGEENSPLENEVMSIVSPDSNSQIQTKSNCDATRVNGQNEAANMNIDIISEHENGIDSRQSNANCCFAYANSSNINVTTEVMNEPNSNINQDSSEGQTVSEQMEQSLCSPVTQIYNKIVDDIETYALPLEPNQFNESHHHNLPVSLLPEQTMVMGADKRLSERQHSNEEIRSGHIVQQFDGQSCGTSQRNRSESKQEQSDSCPMILTSCDLFGNQPDRVVDQVNDRNENRACDNLLMAEFNLQSSSQVNDDLGASVVESLANVDDLRDLIMGISSCSDTDPSNLLVDATSLDLFNFKADCEPRQPMDVKSTTSETDTLNRLSPLVPVPRCNSTGNALQTSSHRQNQQLSNSYFQACNPSSLITNDFSDFSTQGAKRSSSVNPGSSTSCSPSPSSTSLRNVVQVSTQSVGISNSEFTGCQESSSFIKLPLQQRQRSEQQEPSTTVLNSLLPKAISLDGTDLSNNNLRIASNPSSTAFDNNRREQNLLLIPSNSVNQRQQRSNYQHLGANHLRASVSPSIPLDDSSEILVNAPHKTFNGSPSYNLNEQQQAYQSQRIENGTIDIGKKLPTSCLLPILDYVPNWSNITGGAKVLIVGDWAGLMMDQTQQKVLCKDESLFHVLFDDLLVPATLIQDNVLRCYAPSHEQGFITLKVLYINRIVSEQVLFEMRPSCNQQVINVSSQNLKNNHNSGSDPSSDNNSNLNGNNNTQHRNSTSSNQSTSSSSYTNQKSQISPQGNSISGDNSKVLVLAENIISAMHKKNNNNNNTTRAGDFRLANSLDVESLDHYQQYLQQPCQRQRSFKNGQRQLTGSRSLSRDSEPNSIYALNFDTIGADPYWHKSTFESESMQPLSVMTDFPLTNRSIATNVASQKRHSSGSSGFLSSHQQQSVFLPYVQRSNLVSMQPALPIQQPNELHNQTETSSSGLGSIVSSLSPSTSSLHSPSSACTATRDCVRDIQSPCSCGRQSSGTPTSADFCEYFQASAKTEESFASLTLNDREQQELYEAAKIIQKAYRTYRGRKRQASELLVEPNPNINGNGPIVADYQASSNLQVGKFDSYKVKAEITDDPISELQQRCSNSSLGHFGYINSRGCIQQSQPSTLVACHKDREMQAATIIQAYYRRYRQYVHYKRQQQQQPCNRPVTTSSLLTVGQVNNAYNDARRSPSARLVVDTLPIVIDKATTSHVDRKRFKTAILFSNNKPNFECQQQQQ